MPTRQDLAALETLHSQIRARVTGTARRLLDEHEPYDTDRDPNEQPDTPDVGCGGCVNLGAVEDPTDLIPGAWPCLPVRAVAELTGITIPAEMIP